MKKQKYAGDVFRPSEVVRYFRKTLFEKIRKGKEIMMFCKGGEKDVQVWEEHLKSVKSPFAVTCRKVPNGKSYRYEFMLWKQRLA